MTKYKMKTRLVARGKQVTEVKKGGYVYRRDERSRADGTFLYLDYINVLLYYNFVRCYIGRNWVKYM